MYGMSNYHIGHNLLQSDTECCVSAGGIVRKFVTFAFKIRYNSWWIKMNIQTCTIRKNSLGYFEAIFTSTMAFFKNTHKQQEQTVKCDAERNWSTYEFTHSEKRNRLTESKSIDLDVLSNRRLLDKISILTTQKPQWTDDWEQWTRRRTTTKIQLSIVVNEHCWLT